MKTKIFLLIIALSVSIFAQAQAPKYSNEFLSLGIGGRGLAMSNSVVASSGDVTSGYWNPAGLVSIKEDMQLGLMHSEYFAGLAAYDYLAGAVKLTDSSAIAVSMIRFGVDNIPNTLELIDADGNIRYDRIKNFSVADYAFLISYAKVTNIPGLTLGGNVKIIRRVAGDFADAWGFGLDVSAIYKKNKWVFGGNFRDVTSTFNAWSFNTSELKDVFEMTGNEVPENSLEITLPKLLLGVSRSFNIYKKIDGLVEFDMDITTDGKRNVLIRTDLFSFDPHIGAEFSYNRLVFFRFGLGNIQQVPNGKGEMYYTVQPNIGLGINYKRLRLDYAYTNIGDASIALYSHVISLHYGINKKAASVSKIE